MRLYRQILVALAFAAPAGAQSAGITAPVCAAQPCGATETIYLGSRASGPGQGIVAARFDPSTGRLTSLGLVAEVARPTWVMPSPHRAVIYSVSDVGDGDKSQASVLSFTADRETGKLTELSRVASGGGGATFLTIGKTPALLVANYASGQVGVVPLQPGGRLLPVSSIRADTGSGPKPRQTSPHPQGIVVDESGRYVLVTDLGADRELVYRFDPETLQLTPAAKPFVALPPGSGPRHIVMLSGGRFVYVNNELSVGLSIFAWNSDRGELRPIKTVAMLPRQRRPSQASAGEVALSLDGRFLYASVRGEDLVIVYAVNSESGDLTELQRIPSGGKAPTAFSIDPTGRWLLIANTESNRVAVFARDPVSGQLTETNEGMYVAVPSSFAILIG